MMTRVLRASAVFAAALFASVTWAQTATVDHLSQADILAKAQQIAPQAADTGIATIKLSEYPGHYTMIALRTKSGVAEIHEEFADFLFVVRGKATLVTGGTVPDSKTVSPGELRGASVQGGSNISLAVGDVVHIPAKVPHQLLLAGHGEFVYFVIKVKEQ